ncbi:hypothetical protein BAE44_0019692 [Dichanthelium oligosanthes]|uniref:Uncharacterized protein n=1 Tax=Dichanthelium oligosanthes TaxID=888268 RepID=A0A1E5V2F0_9POAL|nr:hypothetical protein BAE44_0019692 [Dichanthelium oligosanthes]
MDAGGGGGPTTSYDQAAGDDSNDDEHFSLTFSNSEASDAGADPPAFHPAALGDGEDHSSRLPDALLSNIISRLATKEAARTVVLSTRWRGVWTATPLLVYDAHLVGADEPNDIPIVRAVSRCVAAHPGPVRGVRVTRFSFYSHEYALWRLVPDLAGKDVQDIILFNHPWPLNMPLPDDILRCASLERLYLGVWHFFEITAAHPLAFGMLRELGLLLCIVLDEELDALLAHCPKLELLSIVMSYATPSRLRICLKRFIFQAIDTRRPVKIVCAPRLEVLGFLDLNLHELEIYGTVIKPIPYECSNSAHDLEFWESLGSCKCLKSHLKALVVHRRLVQNKEIACLQDIIREGKALKAVTLVLSSKNQVAIDVNRIMQTFHESVKKAKSIPNVWTSLWIALIVCTYLVTKAEALVETCPKQNIAYHVLPRSECPVINIQADHWLHGKRGLHESRRSKFHLSDIFNIKCAQLLDILLLLGWILSLELTFRLYVVNFKPMGMQANCLEAPPDQTSEVLIIS